jgi:hypothetical protein
MKVMQAKATHEMLYSDACEALRAVFVRYNNRDEFKDGIPAVELIAVMSRAIGYAIGAAWPKPETKDKKEWETHSRARAMVIDCAALNITKGIEAWDNGQAVSLSSSTEQ